MDIVRENVTFERALDDLKRNIKSPIGIKRKGDKDVITLDNKDVKISMSDIYAKDWEVYDMGVVAWGQLRSLGNLCGLTVMIDGVFYIVVMVDDNSTYSLINPKSWNRYIKPMQSELFINTLKELYLRDELEFVSFICNVEDLLIAKSKDANSYKDDFKNKLIYTGGVKIC